MTPTDCLKAGPAELAPIIEQMMPTWRAHFSPGGKPFFAYLTSWGLDGYFDPFEIIEHAFRIQSRVAELGLQREFAECLSVVSGANESWEDGLYGFCLATASPLNRTRAACAAYIESLESKEPARG